MVVACSALLSRTNTLSPMSALTPSDPRRLISKLENQNIGTSAAQVMALESPISVVDAPSSFSRNRKRKFSITPVPIPHNKTTAKNVHR